jgi:Domain of unknown function (DUF4129)
MTPASWPPHHGLDPTPPQARGWLEQELHRSDYQSPWLSSVFRWVLDQLSKLLDGVGLLPPVIAVLVVLVVIALLAWVLPKVRRESVDSRADHAVLEDLTTTARTYRDRAAEALRDGRYDDVVLDGFRAIAKDMSDRTVLDDAPGRTAHEASLALAPCFPDQADRLARVADLFDAVRYGHRHATADQAGQVQHLDAELVTTRPVLAASPLQDQPV